MKGFSERNLGIMVAFYREYSCVAEFLPQPVAKLLDVGKMNFYCSAVDDLLKHPTDQPTIGLILC